MKYWDHQERIHQRNRELYASNVVRWTNVAPCGAGKSVMMSRIALPAAKRGMAVSIYTHRRMLTSQLFQTLTGEGVPVGVYANGFEELRNESAPVQICSLPTVYSRLGDFRHRFPFAEIVIVDEAHQQTGQMAQKVMEKHLQSCKKYIGFTATPVNLGGMYDHLVNEVTHQELLDCKAHLPIDCYGPDRPDLSKLKTNASGDFSFRDDMRINRVPTIIGRVYNHWEKLNPDALPAIGFAPSVDCSKGFVHQFQQRGVPCAHIDAERVMLVAPNANGKLVYTEYENNESSREEVLQGSKEGRYKIVWNRFVLREAIDMPWLYHAISATSMGSVATFVQSIGRVLRYWPEYDKVILQDHGGNIDRHGMPNEDRDWTLGCTSKSIHQEEKARRQRTQGEDAEPICCPKCGGYRTHGQGCPHCGHLHRRSVRLVRQLDGTLVKKTGRTVKYKRPKNFDDYYRSALYGGYFKGRTVKQAYKFAQMKAKEAGVSQSPVRMWVPPTGDRRWDANVREVYPKFRPRSMK